MTYETVITRKTAETDIRLALSLRGEGSSVCNTDCGSLNHMLTLFAKHGHFDLEVSCKGDSEVDFHHTTEDIATPAAAEAETEAPVDNDVLATTPDGNVG